MSERVQALDEESIRQLVRRVVFRTVGIPASPKAGASPPLITEADVRGVPTGGEILVPRGTLVTPLARQIALDRHVTLRDQGASPTGAPRADPGAGTRTVALGADHGGYELKEQLKNYVDELGFVVADCGTDGTASVDYPDYALAVAGMVAQGTAWRGILVDGAGIGSCMAANKVPGVRAAMCYDQATAANSREHNHANVLTLGAGLIGASLARQIVKCWLETAAGGGRHERRVNKIMEIERRFTKGNRA